MNNTPMRSGQDPAEYLYSTDNWRGRLNACDPPEGPTDRLYDDIIFKALQPEYKAVRQTHLEREASDLPISDALWRPFTQITWPVRALIHSRVSRDVEPPYKQ